MQPQGTAKKKRKDGPGAPDAANPPKRSKLQAHTQTSLIGPHEALLSQLRTRHDMLVASVISSTKIGKRVAQILSHLGGPSDLPAVVLLHARTAEVCKMISIAEQCKRLLVAQGKSWFQYNQMFEVPAEVRDAVGQTVRSGDGELEEEEESDDGFEVMAGRFEKAVVPAPRERAVRSMRVFLSVQAIGELGSRDGITTQSSEDGA